MFNASQVVRMVFYYAVRTGRKPGIYRSWFECEMQVKGFPKARFKKFSSEAEANAFIETTDSKVGTENLVHVIPCKKSYESSGQYDLAKNVILTKHVKRKHQNETFKKNSMKKQKLENAFTSGREGSSQACVYTDGACVSNGKVGARAGIGVFWATEHPLNVSERLPGRQTNNRAEIHAAVRAIRQAKLQHYKSLTIYTDSQFMINAMTKWIKKWKINDWHLASGGPVINREDFEELESAMDGINIQWEYVAGHSGNPGNDGADSLAVLGAQKRLI